MQQKLDGNILQIKNAAFILEEEWNAHEERYNKRTQDLDARERALNCRKRKLDDRETALRDGEAALTKARDELNSDIDDWTNGISPTQLTDDTKFTTSPELKQESLSNSNKRPFVPPPKSQPSARRVRKRTSTDIQLKFSEPPKCMIHNTRVHICARL